MILPSKTRTRSSVDRATDCGSVGRRFDSYRVRQEITGHKASNFFLSTWPFFLKLQGLFFLTSPAKSPLPFYACGTARLCLVVGVSLAPSSGIKSERNGMMGKNEKYTPDVRRVINCAREETQRLRHRLIGPEHLLLSILKVRYPLIEGLFASLQVSTVSLIGALDFVIRRGNKAILSEPILSVSARAILVRAEEEAEQFGSPVVGIEYLVLALLEEHQGVIAGILESFGIDCDHAHSQLLLLMEGGSQRVILANEYHSRYESTPALNQVSYDLTMAALEDRLDPLIGRQGELERTMQILARRTRNNPVLIGPAGVGKTAIAEGLAQLVVQEQVPDNLLHSRVVALDVGLLSSGTRFRGDFEERLKRILHEVATTPGIIVVIDELHTLVQTGVAEGSLDTANLFKPMLARGEFRCIGATTLDQYRKTIEADPALERRFQPVLVAEATAEDTL